MPATRMPLLPALIRGTALRVVLGAARLAAWLREPAHDRDIARARKVLAAQAERELRR